MKQNRATISENPGIRIPTIDEGRFKDTKNSMVGLLEIDITSLRAQIRELHKNNVKFSFTSCIIKILGDCIAENKNVQAGLLSDHKLVSFDDVDISISIERYFNGMSFPFPLVIRAVNRKSILEINVEIQNEIDKKITSESELFVPGESPAAKVLVKLFYSIPSRLRIFIMQLFLRNPVRAQKTIGTVGFANVSMAGRLSGWTFPTKNPYSLYFALGSINKKALVVQDEIKVREVLNLTAIFDHRVIDGAPARRFMNSLVSMIENGRIDVNKRQTDPDLPERVFF
jgi:hypothetical protein